MLFISLPELENAINFWRNKSPSVGDSLILSKEASALAKPYAILILQGAQRISVDNLDPNELDAWNRYLQESFNRKG
ncbi:DUF3717 domain-containing protein [Polynucleobacter kasalickyi]|uniref:DUF3717 domain-containing protein n=1 Tax=Polynucleobacter kasalickyi TaxID=1938817 RepID=A0A1W2BSY7_9BURK|nr:DUF3717 domain-containing protein [Polynucleobacter kasalickyi]SMC75698.1 Protein of unknown function [Polynucleobacter kasalickyi]